MLIEEFDYKAVLIFMNMKTFCDCKFSAVTYFLWTQASWHARPGQQCAAPTARG